MAFASAMVFTAGTLAEEQLSCDGVYAGCFKDVVPAPGVPPVRVVDHLAVGPVQNMSVAKCASTCAVRGYYYFGITGHPAHYYCYCGCSENTAAPHTANSTCAAPCARAQEPSGHCGANGVMAAYKLQCTPLMPPSPICGGGGNLPAGPACSQKAAKNFKFCDTTASLHDRVTDLVNRISPAEAGPLLTARQSPSIPRLGIPSFYWGTNAIHGVAYANSTTFPEPLNIGATFNRTVMRGVGRVIGREMRAWFNAGDHGVGLTSWSPTINIIRDQRWGRNQETVSEDPLLAGEYGKQFSLGMQYNRGSSAAAGKEPPPPPASNQFMAVATLKHVLAYSVDDWSPANWSEHVYNRVDFDAHVSSFDLEDTYTQPFRRAISEGGAAGVMYACNKVNGVPAVASADLASRLRSWGFSGYRTTDGDGINGMNTPARQNYTRSIEESIAAGLTFGESDIDDGDTYSHHLVDALSAGAVNMSTVRRSLYNTFQIRFRLGLFDPIASQPYAGLRPSTDVAAADARALNREASIQSLVLLQNRRKTLPLRVPRAGKVVVVGASANSSRLFGGGHYARRELPSDDFLALPAAIGALLTQEGSAASVDLHPGMACTSYADGACTGPKRDAKLLAEATDAAGRAAQVVVMLNLQSLGPCRTAQEVKDGGEFDPCGYEAEQADRPHSTPPKHQNEVALAVLAAAAKAKIPAVVVLVHGGGMAIDEVKANADAIVDAHYPGEATGGPAIAGLLYGKYSPGGKLPYSLMPAAFDGLSDFGDMSMTAPPGRTYKYYPTSPETMPPALWPFGFGLTYTKWEISVAPSGAANKPLAHDGSPSTFTVTLKNVGAVDSDEVVQVYFAPQFKRQDCPTPRRQLIDFERVHVSAGAAASLQFVVTAVQLELAGPDGMRAPHPGLYTLEFTNGAGAISTTNVTVSERRAA